MTQENLQHKNSYTPTEFYIEDVRAKLDKLSISDSIRIGHAYKENGSECSIGKDKCMMITHYHGGYYFYCFRCKEQGWVDQHRSPKQVLADAKRQAENESKKVGYELKRKFDVPYDCVLASDIGVPEEAMGWLNRYHITDELIEKYNIQYSQVYDRIIFPIYEYYIGIKKVLEPIIGWCGRCYHDFDKEERIENRRPKYIVKKDTKQVRDRIFWCKWNNPRDIDKNAFTVVVEDIVSAIRVYESTGYSVLALLTTSFPTNIMGLFQNTVIMWLDYDAQHKSFKYVIKMNQVGIKSFFISTKEDPKTFDNEDLTGIIHRRINNTDAFEVD